MLEERLRGEGITRYDLGRESFVMVVWEWKDIMPLPSRKINGADKALQTIPRESSRS